MIRSIRSSRRACPKAAISPPHMPVRPTGGATRNLLRRHMYFVRRSAELPAQIQNTNTQYNLPIFRKKLSRKYNHGGVPERFGSPAGYSNKKIGNHHLKWVVKEAAIVFLQTVYPPCPLYCRYTFGLDNLRYRWYASDGGNRSPA